VLHKHRHTVQDGDPRHSSGIHYTEIGSRCWCYYIGSIVCYIL